jgi:hypothetical protein
MDSAHTVQLERKIIMMLTTPEELDFFELARLKSAVKLELYGMRLSRGASAYKIAKQRYGLKGNRAYVYKQLYDMVQAQLA